MSHYPYHLLSANGCSSGTLSLGYLAKCDADNRAGRSYCPAYEHLSGRNQSERRFPPRSNTLQVKVDLVLVPVAVTDSSGRLVTGLDKENFEIFEGKERQAIKTFSSEDSPVSVGIIFDTSGSMTDKIERAR